MNTAAKVICGRVWLFGDHVSTDVMMPGPRALAGDLQGRAPHEWCFEAVRPGWSQMVTPGDVIAAGHNFGCGSGRDASRLLLAVGIAAVVAESFAGTFFRNAVNAGLPVLTCPGVSTHLVDGDQVRIDLATGRVTCPRGLGVLAADLLPADSPPAAIMAAGGFEPFVRALLATGRRPDEPLGHGGGAGGTG